MDYNKALNKYQDIVNKLDEQIQNREMIIQSGKDKLKEIKENRKSEIKEGLFSNTLKKFSKKEDISSITTDIEVATVELEALRELRNGDDDNLIEAAKELVKSAHKEAERLREVRSMKEKEIKDMQLKLNEMKAEIYGVTDGSDRVLVDTAYIISDILQSKFPSEYERMKAKGFLVGLMNKLLDE